MVSLNFDNVRCGDGLLAWPSLADNSGSLLVGGLALLLLGFLEVRLPSEQLGSWSMVHGVGIDIGILESLRKVHRNGCHHDRDLHFSTSVLLILSWAWSSYSNRFTSI